MSKRRGKISYPVESQIVSACSVRFKLKELNSWPSKNIQAFMQGISEVIAAGKEAERDEKGGGK